MNPWTVGCLVSPDRHIDSAVIFVLIGLVELALIVAGLQILFGTKPIDRKKLGFRCAAIMLSVFLMEGLLRVADVILPGAGTEETPRYLRAMYRDRAWSKELFAELDALAYVDRAFRYDPFTAWDGTEFHSKYVNVGPDGTRTCWNPEFSPDARPPTLYVFGGSTVWGMGVRDEFTIPSHLSKILDSHGHAFRVHNYGDLAYTFTQEVFNLILLLKAGHRPDFVVFYDGVNDVYAGYQNGAGGHVINCFKLPEKFERSESPASQLARGVEGLIREHSRIYQYAARIVRSRRGVSAFPERGAWFSDERLGALATEIADFYASSLHLLEPLSKEYGFQYVCFWQPVSLLEENLLPGEKEDIRASDTALAKLHKYVLASLNERDLPHFHDLSHAISDRKVPYYFDYCHLSKDGNGAVAAKICEEFEARFVDQGQAP